MGTIEFHVFLGLALFSIGAFGFLTKRSGVVALMCLELMLNGVNLVLVSFSSSSSSPQAGALMMFVVLVAAAEAAVALSLLVAIYRKLNTVYLDDLRTLRG
jgi:NADH-quinone oxidoreductase subunit K